MGEHYIQRSGAEQPRQRKPGGGDRGRDQRGDNCAQPQMLHAPPRFTLTIVPHSYAVCVAEECRDGAGYVRFGIEMGCRRR